MADIVHIQGLTKDYGEGKVVTRALRGVDLGLEAGEFTAMAGPSGSGKSTLLNIIGGLDRPTSGIVAVEGKDLSKLSATALSRLRRDRIGFIFQAYKLIPVLTVMEHAEYVLMLQGVTVRQGTKHPAGSRAGRDGESISRRAFRGAAAAGGHCTGHCLRTGPDSCGRTHRQRGFRDGRGPA